MDAYQRTGRFTIEVQVAYKVLLFGAFDALGVLRVERTRQSILGIVGNVHGIVKVFRFDHSQHWPKNFFLGDACVWVYIRDHRWLNKVARPVRSSTGHQAPLALADLDIPADLL